mmetsp:Transcript_12143/g.24483  ORF Transcript_12143/g.24483 Transcript_12143/m.24483 type:complete len:449 (+) Transcript_12143:99-1445(+)
MVLSAPPRALTPPWAAVPLLVVLFGSAAPTVRGSFLRRSALLAQSEAFEEYVRRHARPYEAGSGEWEIRRELFQRAAAAVQRQNARPDRLWTAALTKLADRTDAELAALRGYDRGVRRSGGAGVGVQLLSAEHREADLAGLPEDFSWRSRLKSMADVQDQSKCGGCWAFSSATVLRAHAELFQQDRKFSVEEIVSCTPNPNECGGQGGCKGATAELAMEYVKANGCQTKEAWEYDGTEDSGRCPAASKRSLAQAPASAVTDLGGMAFGMRGYRRLPENQLAPVLLALVERGPVVVSLAAGPSWNLYHSGILDACPKDAIIDHAVTLVGFGVGRAGSEAGQRYWHIQNSWGPTWGEGGFIRLARHEHSEERRYCGMDTKPQMGSGCKDGPPQVRVCGTCGLLYDVVVPEFVLGTQGLWSSQSFVQGLRQEVRAPGATIDSNQSASPMRF